MRKKEFLTALKKNRPDLSDGQINRMGNRIIDLLMEAMQQRSRIEIRGFGTFFVRTCKSRLLRSPRTGEMIETPVKHIPRFKAGKELKEKVNDASNPPASQS